MGMHQYQLRSLSLMGRTCSGNCLPYGAGKSWVSLEHAYSHFSPKVQRCAAVIFCRPRLVHTWVAEIRKRYPKATISQDLEKHAHFMIISHSRILRDYKAILMFLNVHHPRVLIFDESTRIKNPKSQISQTMHAIARHHVSTCGPNSTRIFQTGRPMPESPLEMWSQFEFAYPFRNPLGPSYYAFTKSFCLKTDYGYALDLSKAQRFYDIVRSFIIELDVDGWKEFQESKSVRRDYIIEYFDETAEQRRMLDSLEKYWELDDGIDEVLEYKHSMSVEMKRQQIASGFYYNECHEPVRLKDNPKLEVMSEVLEELFADRPSRKVVIWHAFEGEREELRTFVDTSKYSGVVGIGETELERFANDTAQIIVAPLGCGEGLNELTVADTAIFYSNVPSSEKREQAEARLDRLGQASKVVTIIDLCGPRMRDHELVTLLQGKALTNERLNTIVRTRSKEKLV